MTDDVFFFASNYSAKKSCLKEYVLGKQVGEGNFGFVYDVCDKDDCKNILKVMSLPIDFGNSFEDEVKYTKYASDN